MRNCVSALAAIHSTVWSSAVGLLSLAGLLKTLASGSIVSLLFSRSSHKHIEKSLTQDGRLFSAFMDNLPAFAWIKDLEGRYVYVNKLVIARLTPSASESLGKTDAELWPGEIGATYRANDLKVIASRETLETIETFLLEGERRYLLASRFPIFDHTGAVTMVGGTGADITERKRAEDERDRLFNLSLDPLCVAGFDGYFRQVNPAWTQALGWSEAELLSRPWLEFVHPEDRAATVKAGDALASNQSAVGFENRYQHKDGSYRWFSWNSFPLSEARLIFAVVRDITERKLIEEALRESEERYRVVTETASEAIITIDESSTILFVNPATEQIFGYSAKEMLGEQLTMLMPEYLRHVHKAGLNRYAETGRKHISWQGTELPGLHKSKQEIPLEVSFSEAITDGHHYFTGIARDVTNRKRAEESLKQSEQHFRNLFEQAHDAIIVFNPEHEIVLDVNERACELYGFSRLEFIGMSLEAISKDVGRGKNKIGETLERGDYLNFETVQYRKDGSEMVLEINASTILYQGQLVILSINRDVTERTRADEKLQNSEKYFRSLIENASDLITVCDGNGIIRYESPSLERMLGYKPEERMGKSVFELLHPDDLAFAKHHFATGMQNPGIVHFMECRFQHKDGSWHLVETAGINLLDDPVVAGIVVNSRDISERKRAEELLLTFPRRLIEAQEAERTRIARELHDEIGQVLTVIALNLQAVRASALTPAATPKVDESILVVQDALHHVQNLALELRPSLLDDLGLAAAVGWFADRYSQRTGIQTEVTTDVQITDGRLSRDLETASFRIVQEALTNVARHAKAKSVSIQLRAFSDETCISIRDDGAGFDASAGNGAASFHLGLRGMEERALALGGRLEIKSAPAGGTEILAFFPNEMTKPSGGHFISGSAFPNSRMPRPD